MTSHFEVLYRNHQKGRIRRMLATIWRADVQSSQAQQRRTAFRGVARPTWETPLVTG
jgi:hypothetical protein